ncbi:hypothetical protein YC2023_019580 [Brassica napus]
MVGGAWPFLVGGAWPFLVGGTICLVNSVNERDLTLLTSYVEASLHGRLLRETKAIIAIVGLQRGISSKRESSARVDYVNLRKDHCRTLETERPENDETSLPARLQVWLDHTHSFWISSNPGTKSVKENATKQPAFANPERVFVRKLCYNVKSKTTIGNGYLSSRIDEERSEMSYLNPVNHQVFERKLRPKPSGQGHVCLGVTNCRPPPSSQGYGTEADLLCATARGWPKPELRMPGTA